MPNRIVAVTAIALALGLAACDQAGQEQAETPNREQSSPSAPQAPPSAGPSQTEPQSTPEQAPTTPPPGGSGSGSGGQ